MLLLFQYLLVTTDKCDAQLIAWDMLQLWQEIYAINAQSSYLNKTAVIVIISMRSLVSIKQQSPRKPCDINSNMVNSKFH